MRKITRGATAVAAICLAPAAADAAVTVNILQVGSDVVATASGTLSLTGLTSVGSFGAAPGVTGANGFISFFATGSGTGYTGFTGPASWGSGGYVTTTMTPGASPFGINAAAFGVPYVFVSTGFVSGGSVTGSGTWTGATFASLGLTQGTYVYTSRGDTITVNIGQAVPEPATWAMMLGGFGLIGASIRNRKVKARLLPA